MPSGADGFTTWKGWAVGFVVSLVLFITTELPRISSHPDLQLFIKEVAFALFISCIFGLTLEQIQRRQFVRLVTEERKVLKKDVFLYAYGHNIPEKIREEIRNRILHQSFYRENLTIEWEFSVIPEEAEFLSVNKHYSYKLVNNSNEDREWPFAFIQIGADDKKAVAESKFIVLRIQRQTKIEECRPEQMKREQPPDQPHMRKISTTVKIGAGESVGIYYEVAQMRRLYGDDKYNPREPVTGRTTVRVRFPKTPCFDLTVSCKTEPLQTSPDNEPPSRYSFYYEEALLPYQGITISWSQREDRGEGGADLAPPQNAG